MFYKLGLMQRNCYTLYGFSLLDLRVHLCQLCIHRFGYNFLLYFYVPPEREDMLENANNKDHCVISDHKFFLMFSFKISICPCLTR